MSKPKEPETTEVEQSTIELNPANDPTISFAFPDANSDKGDDADA